MISDNNIQETGYGMRERVQDAGCEMRDTGIAHRSLCKGEMRDTRCGM